MKIFEAYDDTSIRLLFKGYIEAEGVSVSKREQIYTRFGTYMSRIRGVLYDRLLLGARDEAHFRDYLSMIFYDKWKDHLGYPEIPDYFFRYLDFLHTLRVVRDDFEVEGLSEDNDCEISDGKLSRYEQRFVAADGKLRLLANPMLIQRLRDRDLWKYPANGEAIQMCEEFYSGSPLCMSHGDWATLIEECVKPPKNTKKRADISFEAICENGETVILNSTQAMEHIARLAGLDRIAQCNLRLNGQPVVVKRVPKGKEATFKNLGEGYFLNNMGKPMDKFKLMRILVSIFRLPLEINLSKEKAVKSPRTPRKTKPMPSIPESPSLSQAQPPTQELPKDDFIYGKDGILNLFDDL